MEFTCLLCNNTTSAYLTSDLLRDDNSGRFPVVRCAVCGHTQLSPLPSEEEEDIFYMRDMQVRGLFDTVDLEMLRKKAVDDTERRKKWTTSKLNSKQDKVLDIGCGYGFFVNALEQDGYPTVGIDISEDRIELAKTHQGTFLQRYIDGEFVNEHKHKFKVVTLFHVLEHIRNPVKFLQLCSGLVADDGYLLIEVPNLKDDLLNTSDPYKRFYWQRAHLSYFDASRLELAFFRAEFQSYNIAGVQRYGLRNRLHWIDTGTPQLIDPDYKTSEQALRIVERIYREDRERTLTSDTLIAEVNLHL